MINTWQNRPLLVVTTSNELVRLHAVQTGIQSGLLLFTEPENFFIVPFSLSLCLWARNLQHASGDVNNLEYQVACTYIASLKC